MTSTNNFYNGFEAMQSYNNTYENINATGNRNHGITLNAQNIYPNQDNILEDDNVINCNLSRNGFDGLRLHYGANITIKNIVANDNLYGINFRCGWDSIINNCTFRENAIGGIKLALNSDRYSNITINGSNFIRNSLYNLEMENDGGEPNPSNITYNEFLKSNRTNSKNIFYTTNWETGSNFLHNHYSDHIGFDVNPVDGFADNEYIIVENSPLINDSAPLFVDDDGDGLDNLVEEQFGTFINNPDSDGDRVTDFQELYPGIAFTNQSAYTFTFVATDPFSSDTDGDGLSDSYEYFISYTNPALNDTDFDGFSDPYEVTQGTDPTDSSQWPGQSEEEPDTTDKGEIEEQEPDRSILAIPSFPTEIIALISMLGIIIVTTRISKSSTKSMRRIK